MAMLEIWTEKYRPSKLEDIVGQKNIVHRLKAFVAQGSMPHLMFAGSAGIGKTTSAIALAKELYGDTWAQNFMETNASDERGIDVVRNKIKDFARVKPLNTKFKVIFLDECDALTQEAQQALRRTMERYTSTTRFILSCNYSSKIIPPIQSRCAIFRFGPLKNEDIKEQLEKIAKIEGLTIQESGMNALLEVADGDMRKAVNLLQSVSITVKDIDGESVYQLASALRPQEVKNILQLALDKKFIEAREKLTDLMFLRGIAGTDVIRSMHKEIIALPVDEQKKAYLIDKLGEYEFRIVEGGTDDLQIEAFLAQLAALD